MTHVPVVKKMSVEEFREFAFAVLRALPDDEESKIASFSAS